VAGGHRLSVCAANDLAKQIGLSKPDPLSFVQVDRVEFVAGFPDIPSDPAVVVVNPDDEITPESFTAWLDRRQAGEAVDPGARAADTLAEARAAGEV
jgi:hypothetical protein